MKGLYLGHNKITEIPTEIGNLLKLERLEIDNNQLREFPLSLTNLTNLQELHFYNNFLITLAKEIQDFIQFKRLKLNDD